MKKLPQTFLPPLLRLFAPFRGDPTFVSFVSFCKTSLSLSALALALVCTARAATTYTFNMDGINTTIPDGDLNGLQNSQTLSGVPGNIFDVNVTLNISGGFNGDYYAYLTHSGSRAVLLNRVGRTSTSNVGYPDAGFGPDASANKFTFDDQAGHDAHLYRTFSYTLNGSGQLTGQWQPDGRNIDPLSVGSAFDGASRSNLLGLFNGLDPNGLWTLYVADVSSGAEGMLMSWGMVIQVPEPSSAALALCALGAGVLSAAARRRSFRARSSR